MNFDANKGFSKTSKTTILRSLGEQNNNFNQRDPLIKEDRAETAWMLIEDLKNMLKHDFIKNKRKKKSFIEREKEKFTGF